MQVIEGVFSQPTHSYLDRGINGEIDRPDEGFDSLKPGQARFQR
jgi:hypothetical protein